MRGGARAVVVAVGVLSGASAFAADLPTTKEAPAPIPEPVLPSTWHFEATLDGWAPSLTANVGVRNLPALPVYANIFKLLPHLEGFVPVSVVAYNDNFIVRPEPLLGPPGPQWGVYAGGGSFRRRERRPET